MSGTLVGAIAMLALIALILVRVPVAVALGVVGMAGYAAIDSWRQAFILLGDIPFRLAESYSLSVVPLFILMGFVATRSHMSKELFQAANAIFTRTRGALACATIGACAAFGSICGSSLATAATMSQVAIPEMRRYGYDDRLATGSVASGGTLGILIPPSVILVIYAIIAEESVPKLFAAGLIPGLILAMFHVIVIVVLVRLRPGLAPSTPSMALRERLWAMVGMWKLVLLFFLAVGGIYIGWFSPTEAAAVGAFTAILIALATRTMGFRGLVDAALDTVFTTAMLFFVIIGAFIFARFVVLTQVPVQLIEIVNSLGLTPFTVLLIMVAFYVVLGCFLESVSMILITVPVFLPLIHGFDLSPVWFGILVVVVAEVGLITPPVGLNIFVIRSQMPDIPLSTIYRGVTPFLAADGALILLLLLAPQVALWLPAVLKL